MCVYTAGHSKKSTAKLFSSWNVANILLVHLKGNCRPVLHKYRAVYITISAIMACEKLKIKYLYATECHAYFHTTCSHMMYATFLT